MEQTTKHQELIMEYVKKSNLEIIVQQSIGSLVQNNILPDNPFGAMFRHFTFFAAKDDLNRLQQKVKGVELNALDDAGLFSVTNQEKELECFGLPHLLHYINGDHFKVLSKTLKEMFLEHIEKYGDYVLQVRSSIGGSEIFKGPLVPHCEVAPTPLELRSECMVEGPRFENAFNLFAEYVYDDIMRIGSNNALNLVRDYCVEQGANSTYVKRISLEDMQRNKQLLINELKNATIQKRHSYIRILVFSQDLERYSSKDLIRAVTPSRLLSQTEPSVLDHFQYISTKKSYVLHFTSTGHPTDYTSLSPIPCLALYNSLFPNPDSARNYAKVFYTEKQNPYEIPAIEDYLQAKRDKIIKYYKNGKIIKMIWEMLELVLCSKDHANNLAVAQEIFSVLTHPSCKLYKIVRMAKALIILINSFYDTGFVHFKKLAEGLFVRLKEECWSAFGNASSAELILLKPFVMRMMDATSVNRSRTLKITPNTLRILERLENICSALAKNVTELLIRHLPSVNELHQRLLLSYKIQPGLSYSQFTSNKQTDSVFNIDDELKAQNLRRDNEYTVIFDYLITTGVMEILVLTTRELIMSYPLLPNPLKIYAVKLLGALFRYDMFISTPSEVLEKYMHVPNQLSEDVYVHNGADNMFNMPGLPYVTSFESYLLISSWQEIAFFRTIFSGFELEPENFSNLIPSGYTVQSILSVCGTSVVNPEALSKFPNLWHVYTDIFITGASFNAASHTFLEILVRYALWVDSATSAQVCGFFTPFSEQSLASFENLVSATERKHSAGLLLSAFQMNSRVWLRFIIPYSGRQESKTPGMPIVVHVYFNMHFRVNISKKLTSLVPLSSLEDIVKVFFSREDFELWKELISLQDHGIIEKLMNEIEYSYDMGQHYRGAVCLMFKKIIEKDKDSVARLLRMNDTPIKSIIESGRYAKALIDLVELAKNSHRKTQVNLLIEWVALFDKYLQACFYQERNAILENSQIDLLRVSERLVAAISNSNGPKYSRVLSHLKQILKHLRVAKLVSSLAIFEVLQEKVQLAK